MTYWLLMNKKGFFKPFKENKLESLARLDLELTTRNWSKIVKFYNFRHPEKWFFYWVFDPKAKKQKFYSHLAQVVNCN